MEWNGIYFRIYIIYNAGAGEGADISSLQEFEQNINIWLCMESPLLYNDDKPDNLFTMKYFKKLCSEFSKRKIMHIKVYCVQTYPRVCRQNNKKYSYYL